MDVTVKKWKFKDLFGSRTPSADIHICFNIHIGIPLKISYKMKGHMMGFIVNLRISKIPGGRLGALPGGWGLGPFPGVVTQNFFLISQL